MVADRAHSRAVLDPNCASLAWTRERHRAARTRRVTICWSRQVARAGGWTGRAFQRTWEITMKELLVRFVREDEGQDLVEYALLIAFIALLCILGMQTLGQGINKKFSDISSSLNAS